MRYTFCLSTIGEGLDVFALAKHIEFSFCDVHDGHHILPFVLFANEELVIGGERNSSALADQAKEGHVALYQLKITRAPIVMSG